MQEEDNMKAGTIEDSLETYKVTWRVITWEQHWTQCRYNTPNPNWFHTLQTINFS